METWPKTLCCVKKLNDVRKTKTVSDNVIHAKFSILCTHDDLAMQALVWRDPFWCFICEFKMTSHV